MSRAPAPAPAPAHPLSTCCRCSHYYRCAPVASIQHPVHRAASTYHHCHSLVAEQHEEQPSPDTPSCLFVIFPFFFSDFFRSTLNVRGTGCRDSSTHHTRTPRPIQNFAAFFFAFIFFIIIIVDVLRRCRCRVLARARDLSTQTRREYHLVVLTFSFSSLLRLSHQNRIQLHRTTSMVMIRIQCHKITAIISTVHGALAKWLLLHTIIFVVWVSHIMRASEVSHQTHIL